MWGISLPLPPPYLCWESLKGGLSNGVISSGLEGRSYLGHMPPGRAGAGVSSTLVLRCEMVRRAEYHLITEKG